MSPYDRLQALGIALPEPVTPVAAFVMAARSGDLVFVSGHIARKDGKPLAGQLGDALSPEEGKAAARLVAIDLLATLHAFLGDLGKVRRIVKVMCLVNSTPQFTQQPLVANGCSELLVDVFGESGRHARSAVGVAQLPFGACVEIELVAEAD
jgi:enamine deaminase RidA (YjgF/YER057c/UK114 family)